MSEGREKRNPWDWAYDNGWSIVTAIGSIIVGGILWVSWASQKIEAIAEDVATLDSKSDARFNKWEDRFWNERAGQQNKQEVTIGYDRNRTIRDLADRGLINGMHTAGMQRTGSDDSGLQRGTGGDSGGGAGAGGREVLGDGGEESGPDGADAVRELRPEPVVNESEGSGEAREDSEGDGAVAASDGQESVATP